MLVNGDNRVVEGAVAELRREEKGCQWGQRAIRTVSGLELNRGGEL